MLRLHANLFAVARFTGPARAFDSELVDAFLISAVATVLIIRVFLAATGYPRLGAGGVHIAHVLWGGLGMLLAILFLLLFRSTTLRSVAALVGGVGFGAFVDEFGKFVTSDNDYFFKPTAAVVYVVFVVLFLASRAVVRSRRLSREETLAQALALAERLPTHTLTEAGREQALALLAAADQGDPLVPALRQRFSGADVSPAGPARLRHIRTALINRADAIGTSRWFRRGILAFFTVDALLLIAVVALEMFLMIAASRGVADAGRLLSEQSVAAGATPITFGIDVIATTIAAGFMVRGIVVMRRSRLKTYRTFELAVLVDLFLAKPFEFFATGFVVAVLVCGDLALLASLRHLQALEQRSVEAVALSRADRAVIPQPIGT